MRSPMPQPFVNVSFSSRRHVSRQRHRLLPVRKPVVGNEYERCHQCGSRHQQMWCQSNQSRNCPSETCDGAQAHAVVSGKRGSDATYGSAEGEDTSQELCPGFRGGVSTRCTIGGFVAEPEEEELPLVRHRRMKGESERNHEAGKADPGRLETGANRTCPDDWRCREGRECNRRGHRQHDRRENHKLTHCLRRNWTPTASMPELSAITTMKYVAPGGSPIPSTTGPSAMTSKTIASGTEASCVTSSARRHEKLEIRMSPTIRPMVVTITIVEVEIHPACRKVPHNVLPDRKSGKRSREGSIVATNR